MRVSQLLPRATVLAYLLLVLLGAFYAVCRFESVPLRPLTLYMYGMLAPYQGYSETSEAFLAEGMRNGEWKRIDLAPYFPVLTGERNMREHRLYRTGAETHRHIAEFLLRGGSYEQVRLSWVQWRSTPEGFWEGYDSPMQTLHLVTVP